MEKTSTQPDLLTIPQVAERLQVSPWTIRAWIRDRELPHIRMGRRVIRVKREALDAFVGKHGIDGQG